MIDRAKANKIVYARVVASENVLPELLERGFNESNWLFKQESGTYGNSSPAGSKFLLAIPLYCARLSALYLARDALTEFGKKYHPVHVMELRLMDPRHLLHGPWRIAGAAWKRRTWVNALGKVGNSNDLSPDSAMWEVSVKRSDLQDPIERRRVDENTARAIFESSTLPGPHFDRSMMKVTTLSEPARTNPEPWDAPWRTALFLGLVVIGIALSLAAAAVATANWNLPIDWNVWIRVVPGGLSLCLIWLFTNWATADRTEIRLKLLGWLGASCAVFLAGFSLSRGIGEISQGSGISIGNFVDVCISVCRALLVCSIVVFVISGVFHFVTIFPNLKALWTISALTVAVTAVAPFSRIIVDSICSFYETSASDLNIPTWFFSMLTAMVAVFAGLAILFVLSVFGWCAYFGAWAGAYYVKVLESVLAILVIISVAIGVAGGSVYSVEKTVAGWQSELRAEGSAGIASSFIYRACVKSSDGGSGNLRDSKHPIVVVEAKDGGYYRWWVGNNPAKFEKLGLSAPGSLRVQRVSDGVVTCR